MKRNKFSLSHYQLSTMDMGYVLPIACYEVLPGDTIQHATSALIRCTPLATPPMHPVSIRIHHWYVPSRIIWDEFEDFITGGDYGSVPPVHPYSILPTGWSAGDLGDHLGLPLNVDNLTFNALPIRAYGLIINEHYRDQDLTPERVVSKASGLDNTTTLTVATANWQKDYFTQARPWAQKSPDISIPMNDASVQSNGQAITIAPQGAPTSYRNMTMTTGTPNVGYSGSAITTTGNTVWGNQTGLAAQTQAAAGTINQLREAFALQRYAEARARYGSRYTEYLRYLGVNSSDSRLQRPEYLGGGKTTLQFSEVLQTGPASDDGSQTVGEMFGHGMGSMRSNRFRRFFEEHGYVMSLMSVMPKPIYSQGISRMWLKSDKEDYFQKELEAIGQQPIEKAEIFVDPVTYPTGAGDTWGWTNRYQEYKQIHSTVANGFRPGALYDDWHFSRAFSAAPVLNDSFIRGPVTKRPFADQTNNTLLVMARHSIQARRMLQKNPTPHVY
ncbi:MAG: major capsid protein [Microviridae sp.]|nr:MAG: major capsid protein [Microviridae sp.]